MGAGRGREEIQSRVEDVGGVSVSISVVCSDSTAQHTLGSDRHTTPRTLQTSLLLCWCRAEHASGGAGGGDADDGAWIKLVTLM